MKERRERLVARLIPLDPQNRVLLLRGVDLSEPEHPFWFTIGGELDGVETPAEAAVREAREEVGLRVQPAMLGDPLWSGVSEFSLQGVPVRNLQSFFVLRVPHFEPTWDGMDEFERLSHRGSRWWPLSDLVECQGDPLADEPIFPPDLGQRLLEVVGSGHVIGRSGPPTT